MQGQSALFLQLACMLAFATGRPATAATPNLSPAGAKAFAQLLVEHTFRFRTIGHPEGPPDYIASARILSLEPNAAVAYRELLKHAAIGGQLYALCGLYFVDRASFDREVQRYRTMLTRVPSVARFEDEAETVASIVESKHTEVVSRDSTEHLGEIERRWLASRGKDLIGGDIPFEMICGGASPGERIAACAAPRVHAKVVPGFTLRVLSQPQLTLPPAYVHDHPHTTARGMYQICVATNGNIAGVSTASSIAGADASIMQQLLDGWAYEPQQTPVCLFVPVQLVSD